jgi:hypothetical protein
MKKITLMLLLLTAFFGYAQPTTNAPAPTNAAADVISVYSATYTDVATNYDPNWGQSGFGMVNPAYDPTTGNLILAYPNFNYQGTELTTQNASGMEFLHVDIWTAADPGVSIVQVSPINNGTGPGEFLVTINHTAGSWTSVDIPKASFTGMTWDSVFQMKFAANGAGSATPLDIYLDNVYFWKTPAAAGTDATLSDLQVDAVTISGFNPSALDYTYTVPNGTTTVPTVTATTTSGLANAVVTPATGIPGTTSILVTAEDNVTTQTYTVEFIEAIATPTNNAPTPTHAAADVISVYSATYTDAATNYDPNWGQSGFGMVNPAYDPGTGSLILAYPNFNYQGTELTTQDASAMEFLHVDIWTAADPAVSIVQVSPINSGTGPGEVLVTINHTAGSWTSVDIPKASFTDMTWDSVFQMKFAANGAMSASPLDIYLDNVYFWKAPALGLNDFEFGNFKVYPNPTQNSWTISTENQKISSIEVFDVLGKNVLSMKPNKREAKINSSGLKTGLYFAQIKTENGIGSIKLIKQ